MDLYATVGSVPTYMTHDDDTASHLKRKGAVFEDKKDVSGTAIDGGNLAGQDRADSPMDEDNNAYTFTAGERGEHLSPVMRSPEQITPEGMEDPQEGQASISQMQEAPEFNRNTFKRVDKGLGQREVRRPKRKGTKKKPVDDIDKAFVPRYSAGEYYGFGRGRQNKRKESPESDFQTPNESSKKQRVDPIATENSEVSREACDDTSQAGRIKQLSTIALDVGGQLKKLASSFERSPKPYAYRKAAKLRMGRAAILESVDKLEGMTDEVVVTDNQTDVQPASALASASDDLAARPAHDMAENQSANATDLFALGASDNSTKPVEEAQDAYLVSRLVCATVALWRAKCEQAMVLGQFVVDMCGEAMWKERLDYNGTTAVESDLEFAETFLLDAVLLIGNFDEQSADQLNSMIDTIAWEQIIG